MDRWGDSVETLGGVVWVAERVKFGGYRPEPEVATPSGLTGRRGRSIGEVDTIGPFRDGGLLGSPIMSGSLATKIVALAAACLVLAPLAASAVITFTHLGGHDYIVSHRVKLIGSRGKAVQMVYTKAASLCVAAGYSHYEILDQESEAAQEDDVANASARVRFHFEPGEGRLECRSGAEPTYVEEAASKLARRGLLPPPAPPAAAAPDPAPASDCPAGCSLEQIAAMARSGLTDEQIRAACEASPARSEG